MTLTRTQGAAQQTADRRWSVRARRWSAVLLGGGLLAGLPSAPAPASPGWLETGIPAQALDYPSQPQVSVDARGNAVASWVVSPSDSQAVRVSTRRVGSRWSSPAELVRSASLAAEGPGHEAIIDASGNVSAVWERWEGTSKVNIEVAEWAAGQRPDRAPAVLSQSASSAQGQSPSIGADGLGNVVTVWVEGTNASIDAAIRSSGSDWEAAADSKQIISTGTQNSDPEVAVGSDGTAVAVWRNGVFSPPAETKYTIHYAYKLPGDTPWNSGGAIAASTGGDANPDVAVDADGNAVVVWEHDSGGASSIRAAVGAFDSTTESWRWGWGEAAQLLSGGGAHNPQVAIESDGEAVVTWEGLTTDRGIREIEGASGSVDSAITSGDPLYPLPVLGGVDAACPGPRAAVAARQTTAVVWRDCSTKAVYSRVRSAQGQWGATEEFPTMRTDSPDAALATPSVAVDGEGNALVAWEGGSDDAPTVESAAYDLAAPAIEGVAVPDRGTAGIPISFSASVFNVWGSTTTTWSFGDGTQATGDSVTHIYTQPGTYTVQVGAADEVGSSSIQTYTITIALSASPPPAQPSLAPLTPAAQPCSSIRIARRKARVTRAGATRLRLRISRKAGPGKRCAGRLTLKTASKIKRGKRKRFVVLGRARFSIAAGERATVRVRLSRRGRRLLARRGRLRAKVIFTLSGAARGTVVQSIMLRRR